MTPERIASLAARSAAPSAVSERAGLLIVHSDLLSDAIRTAWLELRRSPPPCLASVAIKEADGDADLDDNFKPAAGDRFRITLHVAKVDGELQVFFGRSLCGMHAALPLVSQVRVADMVVAGAFETHRSAFAPWTPNPASAFEPSPSFADPRGLARDFTGEASVPADIRPWLERKPPLDEEGAAYQAWRELAAPRLMACLSDQVSRLDGRSRFHFSGPPSCVMEPSPAVLADAWDALSDGAAWVYAGGLRDTDTRRLLLANEWSRSHAAGRRRALGDGALDSAQAAYGAYVKSSSKETLKALADLRKAVLEEAQKISQRAQDLAGSLWKDLSVAAAPFVLKILADAGKTADHRGTGWLAVAAAAFLAFSFLMQTRINRSFLAAQDVSRAVWRASLNTVLSADEIKTFSDDPIGSSERSYNTTWWFVGLVYAVLIVALGNFAVGNLSGNGQQAPAAPATRAAP